MKEDAKHNTAQAEVGESVTFRGFVWKVQKDCGQIGGDWWCFEHQKWHHDEPPKGRVLYGLAAAAGAKKYAHIHHSLVYICPTHGPEQPL